MSSDLSLSASQHERNSRFIQGIFPVNVFTASTFILDKAKPIPRGGVFCCCFLVFFLKQLVQKAAAEIRALNDVESTFCG